MLIRFLWVKRRPPKCPPVQPSDRSCGFSSKICLSARLLESVRYTAAGSRDGSFDGKHIALDQATYIPESKVDIDDLKLPYLNKAVSDIQACQLAPTEEDSGQSREILVSQHVEASLNHRGQREGKFSAKSAYQASRDGAEPRPVTQELRKRSAFPRRCPKSKNQLLAFNMQKRLLARTRPKPSKLHALQSQWPLFKKRRTQQLRGLFTKLQALKKTEASSAPLPFSLSPVKYQAVYPRCLPGRPSSVSLSHIHRPLEQFYPFWSIAFSKIQAHYLPKPLAAEVGKGLWRFAFGQFVQKAMGRHDQARTDRNAILKAWNKLGPKAKRRQWMSALLFALHARPPTAALILQDIWTKGSLHVPAYIAEDCVNHVCAHFFKTQRNGKPAKASKGSSRQNAELCVQFICAYFEYYTKRLGSASLDHHVIYDFLLSHLSEPQFHRFLDALRDSKAKLKTPAILKLIHRSLVFKRIGVALELLKKVERKDFANQSFLGTCVKILRADLKVENLYNLRTNVLSFMLELGILPNRMLYDTILLNAMEAGDRHTAWSFHDICHNNGVKPSAFTYSILLKGVEHGDDFDRLSYVYRAARDRDLANRSPALGFSLVFATYQLLQRKNQKRRFESMLSVYSELFKLDPLQEMGIVSKFPQPEGLMKPNRSVLGCMISAWINENMQSPRLFNVYECYVSLLHERSSRISAASQYPHILNSFIMAFGHQQENLGLCTSIVQTMLDSEMRVTNGHVIPKSSLHHVATEIGEPDHLLKPGLRLETAPLAGSKLPRPDVYTWNILLHIYAKHDQLEAAEKILKLMKIQGAQPNEITWNQLMHAYTRLQDLPMVLNTLERRQQAGFDPDEWTLNTLLKINDRKLLFELIEKASKEKSHSREIGDAQPLELDVAP